MIVGGRSSLWRRTVSSYRAIVEKERATRTMPKIRNEHDVTYARVGDWHVYYAHFSLKRSQDFMHLQSNVRRLEIQLVAPRPTVRSRLLL